MTKPNSIRGSAINGKSSDIMARPCFSRPARILLVLFAFTVMPFGLHAAEPAIRNLDVRGLRVGGAATLTVDGDDLGVSPRLLLPFPAKQTLKPGGNDKKAVFEVALDASVPAGYYHLRVVTEGGVSLPTVIGVDAMPQQILSPSAPALPVALHGSVAGSATVETKFQGKAKQRITIEVEAQRLGSKLRPVVHLFNPRKLQLAWAWSVPTLHGDARLEALLPEDGVYTVTLHDLEYAAAAPSFFRLKFGTWAYVDQVFPPVVGLGKTQSVDLLGMGKLAPVPIGAFKNPGTHILAWPTKEVWSGPRPFVRVSSRAEFIEQPTSGQKPQELPAGDLGVCGRLLTPHEEDRYRLIVTPGKKIRFEVFAERLGAPIDVALVVRNEQGTQLARAEDSPGTLDPVIEYTVPAKVGAIIVGVVDAAGRGGPRGVYRLTVDPADSGQGGEMFHLTTTVPRASLGVKDRAVVPVLVERNGYKGKIQLSLNVPGALNVQGAEIPDDADGTLVTLERGDKTFDPAILRWTGRGADGREATVAIKNHPLERLQPWLADEMALAPSTDKAADFNIDWRELPATAGLVPGVKLTLPVKTTRTQPKTTVKLTLLTSQLAPLLNNTNNPDPNKSLRQEKAIELPATAKDGEIVMLVPASLSAPTYDVAVQAELLGAGKKVLAVAYTPVRRMAVNMPFVIKLDGSERIETMLDAKKGAVVKIAGKIERRAGVKSDIAVTLTGLPAGLKAETATLKGDATSFTLNVALPPTFAAGEIKGIKLTGSFAPEPKTPNVRVRARDVDVTLIVQAAKKP